MICEKKEISKEVVKELCSRFGCSPLMASIFARRNIIEGEQIKFFLEKDLRYLHMPFLLPALEDAVDRILDAKEEGEKVLIFGDRDVDGITSTTILYRCLKSMGIDVRWKIPTGEDAYGLSLKAVEEFASDYGTLIITVDCGISNNAEIQRANELGIDVIVTDHHNPPAILPEAQVIVNPKLEDSRYPFKDISGCAVAFKLACGLRFAQTELYKQEICLLNVRPLNEAYVIECVKMVNMTEKERLTETITPGLIRIENTRLLPFLQGQQIFVWDEGLQKKQLAKIFGNGIEFNMLDISKEIASLIPSVQGLSLMRVKDKSSILRYSDTPTGEIDAFCNIFITYIQKKTSSVQDKVLYQDLQLVSLAALADIMPLKDENRILVYNGINAINNGPVISGLTELLARLNMLGKRNTSSELSWDVVPVLNAAGRLGQPELAVQLFLSEDASERDSISNKIIQMNGDRRQLGNDAWMYVEKQAYESIKRNNEKIIAVVDERIHRGVTGILATNLVKTFNVPAIAITILEDGSAVGSIRSTRGFDVTGLLDYCSDLFINHGGHNYAAGFSLEKANLNDFIQRIEDYSSLIKLDAKDKDLPQIDAEIPHEWLTPDLLEIVDCFEPYGEGFPQLQFFTSKIKIISADIIGKNEKKHLKLTLDTGRHKWPALAWNSAERLGTEINVGDKIDVLYKISRSTFHGVESAQMIINAFEKSN